jgi:hypothetical protein
MLLKCGRIMDASHPIVVTNVDLAETFAGASVFIDTLLAIVEQRIWPCRHDDLGQPSSAWSSWRECRLGGEHRSWPHGPCMHGSWSDAPAIRRFGIGRMFRFLRQVSGLDPAENPAARPPTAGPGSSSPGKEPGQDRPGTRTGYEPSP